MMKIVLLYPSSNTSVYFDVCYVWTDDSLKGDLFFFRMYDLKMAKDKVKVNEKFKFVISLFLFLFPSSSNQQSFGL